MNRITRSGMAVALALALASAGCGDDDDVDNAVTDASDAVDDAVTSASDGVDDAGAVSGSLDAEDQDSDGTTLTVADVSIDGSNGWIAVHQDLDGAPGPVVGFVAVSEGESSDVEVTFDAAVASGDYWPMLHIDTGTAGTYEFPGADVPVMDGDEVVMEQITLTVG